MGKVKTTIWITRNGELEKSWGGLTLVDKKNLTWKNKCKAINATELVFYSLGFIFMWSLHCRSFTAVTQLVWNISSLNSNRKALEQKHKKMVYLASTVWESSISELVWARHSAQKTPLVSKLIKLFYLLEAEWPGKYEKLQALLETYILILQGS